MTRGPMGLEVGGEGLKSSPSVVFPSWAESGVDIGPGEKMFAFVGGPVPAID